MSDYIDGHLSVTLCSEFESHISICKSCAKKLEETKDVVRMLGQLSTAKSPIDCWPAIRTKITSGAPAYIRSWLLNPLFAAPALAILILMMFLVWPASTHEPELSAVPSVEYEHFISAHSRLQRLQAFSDHDAVFVAAELENTSYTPDSNGQ